MKTESYMSMSITFIKAMERFEMINVESVQKMFLKPEC